MVRPSTKLSPRIFMAWRRAWRMKGSPERATRRLRRLAGPPPLSSASRTRRPVSISPKVEALTNRLSEAPRCLSHCPSAIFSAISASAVSLSGMRSSASARHIRMMPSSEVSPYSCMKASTPPYWWRLARADRTSPLASSAMRGRSSSVAAACARRPETTSVSSARNEAAISSRGGSGPSSAALRVPGLAHVSSSTENGNGTRTSVTPP